MQQSSIQYGKVSSIYPHYKPNDVFARDQAYYDQLLNNTRRNPNPIFGSNVQASQQVTYQPVQTKYRQNIPSKTNFPINYQQNVQQTVFMNQSFGYHSSKVNEQSNSQVKPNQAAYNIGTGDNRNPEVLVHSPSPIYQQDQLIAMQQNRKLKQKLDDLINFRDSKDEGSEIVKKHHYNTDSEQGKLINQQQNQIKNLLQQIKANNIDINKFKNAIIELQKSINNIQSVDREIYRQLKNLSNRDQQLLDKATAALARGSNRDEIAGILQKIIS